MNSKRLDFGRSKEHVMGGLLQLISKSKLMLYTTGDFHVLEFQFSQIYLLLMKPDSE